MLATKAVYQVVVDDRRALLALSDCCAREE